MQRYACTLLLGAVLLAPLGLKAADDEHHDHDRDHRYWDSDGRDYHRWNVGEERAWRHYLEERHEQYRDWARANRREQREYWRWRHHHPDRDDRR